ncbi:site-specific DNA-methyltransferase [Corynebacterium lizhenjunii]|uniref:Site-specific DNA-methyltransferase n=1 Tax=Corynebacterium lizhenjunii TaxID=2709394 RepID=A0A7T0KFW6_9CORY|nr:site-specific DNA-methyltransferase [Corynebacterium lizhenjunii]QPK79837.1 site-specific DNA-methyltransferase [Corynebacterium lizhenjunii]
MAQQRLQLTWYNKDKALIPTETGRYGYTWVDPSDPRYCETHTLIYDDFVQGAQAPKSDEFEYSERADHEPQDDNLLILGESGDVLEALTRVPELAEKYVGKVKVIYIDPPFNTAQTFASYEDNLEHSIWLTMMRDRLLHLKKLLDDDGSIWVHLDDVEIHRMRILLDEIFGAVNFVSLLSWEKVAGRDNRSVMSKTCDFILVYAKSASSFKNMRNLLPRSAAKTASAYANPDDDPRGPWTSGDFTAQFNPAENPRYSQRYTLVTPKGRTFEPPSGSCWRYTKDRYEELLADNRVWFGEDGDNIPRLKRFLSEVQDGLVPKTLWSHVEVGHNDLGKKEIQSLFPEETPFSTPKPERLLERIIHIGSNPGDIILDVFAGSGTTAAAAQKMGRRWVTCELLESTFKTFTRPRLEKVINNQDSGGITRTKGERVDATVEGLPDGVSPDDAAKFTSVLNKLIADDPEAKLDPRVKALKAAAKTRRTKEVVNWRGGGGFQVAHLSPACFDYDPALDRVMLTPEATGEVLVASVAANLGFSLLHPDDGIVFDGRRGNSLLKVMEGVATIKEVDRLVEQIQPGETVVLAATVVLDGVREHMRRACKGSRVVAIPDDIFRYTQGGEL